MVLVYELYGLMEILKETKKSVEQQPLPETADPIGGSCFRKGGKR